MQRLSGPAGAKTRARVRWLKALAAGASATAIPLVLLARLVDAAG